MVKPPASAMVKPPESAADRRAQDHQTQRRMVRPREIIGPEGIHPYPLTPKGAPAPPTPPGRTCPTRPGRRGTAKPREGAGPPSPESALMPTSRERTHPQAPSPLRSLARPRLAPTSECSHTRTPASDPTSECSHTRTPASAPTRAHHRVLPHVPTCECRRACTHTQTRWAPRLRPTPMPHLQTTQIIRKVREGERREER